MKPVCLITGANGRLGSALCVELAPTYDIVAVYRRGNPPAESQLRRRVPDMLNPATTEESPPSVFAVKADLSQREDIRRLTDLALAKFGRIDCVVNSAADTKFYGKLTELWDAGDYPQQQLYTNCIAPFQLVSAIHQACWKDRPEENRRWNRNVVNVSSVSGLKVGLDRGQAFYSASKSAMNMLTLFLALELTPYSVRVNGTCPAQFITPAATAKVVATVRNLLEGECTGKFQ